VTLLYLKRLSLLQLLPSPGCFLPLLSQIPSTDALVGALYRGSNNKDDACLNVNSRCSTLSSPTTFGYTVPFDLWVKMSTFPVSVSMHCVSNTMGLVIIAAALLSALGVGIRACGVRKGIIVKSVGNLLRPFQFRLAQFRPAHSARPGGLPIPFPPYRWEDVLTIQPHKPFHSTSYIEFGTCCRVLRCR
jgi:hypothetical protein